MQGLNGISHFCMLKKVRIVIYFLLEIKKKSVYF